jgi:hypothetical protein
MLDDQNLDRRTLVGRLPLDRGYWLRQCAQRQQTKRNRAPHRSMIPEPGRNAPTGRICQIDVTAKYR